MAALSFPLTLDRAEAYRAACAERGEVAFVAVMPTEKLDGINGALGVAVANERGYHPVPLGWARFTTLDAAQDCADLLNQHLHGDPMKAFRIIASTMGGLRYTPEAA
jgi:hypothetical protein